MNLVYNVQAVNTTVSSTFVNFLQNPFSDSGVCRRAAGSELETHPFAALSSVLIFLSSAPSAGRSRTLRPVSQQYGRYELRAAGKIQRHQGDQVQCIRGCKYLEQSSPVTSETSILKFRDFAILSVLSTKPCLLLPLRLYSGLGLQVFDGKMTSLGIGFCVAFTLYSTHGSDQDVR